RRRARGRGGRRRAGGHARHGCRARVGEAAARGLQGAASHPRGRRTAEVDDRQGTAAQGARRAHRIRGREPHLTSPRRPREYALSGHFAAIRAQKYVLSRTRRDMKFGIFIPQGWRFDLVGIDPARQWGVMHDLAQSAEAGPWESLWVYDHFHTTPVPSEEATHEAWTLMTAFAAST